MVLNLEAPLVLRISKLTDYATVILAHLAENRCAAPRASDAAIVADDAAGSTDDVNPRLTSAEIAAAIGIGVPTVSKVLKELQRAGLVASTRGARGGYALARPADRISAADIIDAVEGPVGLTECATQPGTCELEGSCRVGRSWQRVNVAIRRALYEVKLTQLAGHDSTAIAPPDLAAVLVSNIGVRARA
jgi:FeS assembly SUF system regulator